MLVTNHVVILILAVYISWWRHQMETFSALLALCAGNSPVTGEFSSQRPVTRSFDVFFDLRLNKRLSKLWWGWWFETPSRPLWRHCNVIAQMSTNHFCSVYWYSSLGVYQCWSVGVGLLWHAGIIDSLIGIYWSAKSLSRAIKIKCCIAKVLQITGFGFKYIVTTDQREILLNFRSVIITRMTVHCSL